MAGTARFQFTQAQKVAILVIGIVGAVVGTIVGLIVLTVIIGLAGGH